MLRAHSDEPQLDLLKIDTLAERLDGGDENTLSRCLPVLYAAMWTILKLKRKLNFSYIMLRCFEILSDHSTSDMTWQMFQDVRSNFQDSSVPARALFGVVEKSLNGQSCQLVQEVMLIFREGGQCFTFTGLDIVLDSRTIVVVRGAEVGIALPQHLEIEPHAFKGFRVQFKELPWQSEYTRIGITKLLERPERNFTRQRGGEASNRIL